MHSSRNVHDDDDDDDAMHSSTCNIPKTGSNTCRLNSQANEESKEG